jgi:hypothetical protein
MFLPGGKPEYFLTKGWTADWRGRPSGKSVPLFLSKKFGRTTLYAALRVSAYDGTIK